MATEVCLSYTPNFWIKSSRKPLFLSTSETPIRYWFFFKCLFFFFPLWSITYRGVKRVWHVCIHWTNKILCGHHPGQAPSKCFSDNDTPSSIALTTSSSLAGACSFLMLYSLLMRNGFTWSLLVLTDIWEISVWYYSKMYLRAVSLMYTSGCVSGTCTLEYDC